MGKRGFANAPGSGSASAEATRRSATVMRRVAAASVAQVANAASMSVGTGSAPQTAGPSSAVLRNSSTVAPGSASASASGVVVAESSAMRRDECRKRAGAVGVAVQEPVMPTAKRASRKQSEILGD